jgi:ABC-type antimicrobial peptide transport system permease subunit
MVVNEAFARLAWPGRDPIGRRVRFPTDSVERWWTVVGVVGDTRYTDPAKASEPAVYTSSRQGPWYDVWFVVRTSLDPRRAIGLLDRTIQTVDPGFGISEATTGAEQLSARLARPRALATLFSGLAGTALFLAALGLFGVLAAYVRERQREIAIRSALGATPRQLRTLVLVQTLAVTALGVCCGVPLALTGGHILRNMVRDVLPLDSLSLGLVGLILLGVVGLATYAPMVRATRVDARWALASE